MRMRSGQPVLQVFVNVRWHRVLQQLFNPRHSDLEAHDLQRVGGEPPNADAEVIQANLVGPEEVSRAADAGCEHLLPPGSLAQQLDTILQHLQGMRGPVNHRALHDVDGRLVGELLLLQLQDQLLFVQAETLIQATSIVARIKSAFPSQGRRRRAAARLRRLREVDVAEALVEASRGVAVSALRAQVAQVHQQRRHGQASDLPQQRVGEGHRRNWPD
eukprot:scaffold240_cov243-Pinguiococcus_pyrenoidosus.AAC.19